MKKILLIAGLVLLAACERAVDDNDRNRTRVLTDPEELAVWNAVYDDEYKYPEGFYSEPQAMGTSINYLGDNTTVNGKFVHKQRSADNIEQAREWWHAMLAENPQPQTIDEERETDRYFEFVSLSESAYGTRTHRCRIHKSSYFTPIDGMFGTFYYIVLYPELYKPYTIGIYGGELSAGAVEELIESMWYFETHQIHGDKVLKSDFKETDDRFVYTVISTGLSGGDWGLHDEIRVFESTFELDKTTREFRSVDCTLIHTMQGVYHQGMSW